MLKRLKKIVLWVGAILILLLVVFIGINWRDEAPSPLSIALAKLPENNVPDEQNIFYALMGLYVPAGQDMTEQGRQLVSRYLQNEKIQSDQQTSLNKQKGVMKTEFDQAVADTAGRLRQAGDIRRWCEPSLDCLQASTTPKQLQALQRQLSLNADPLKRYRQLFAMEGYFDPLGYQVFDFPDARLVLHRLYQMALHESLIKARQGDLLPILTLLDHDTDLRLKMAESHSIDISVFLSAIRMVRHNVEWVSVILTSPHFDRRQHGQIVQRILNNAARLDSFVPDNLHQSDYLFLKKTVEQHGRNINRESTLSRFVSRRLYHTQAMLNEIAIDTVVSSKIARLPAERWVTEREQVLDDSVPEARYGRYCLLDEICLYNLMGHQGVYDLYHSVDEGLSYTMNASFHDVQSYIRLVNLQFALMQQPFPVDVPVFLAQHPQWFNPYTRQPFDWSAAQSALSFKPYSDFWFRFSKETNPVFRVVVPVQKNISPQGTD